MAKIAIAGNPSGTATYTIASPAGSTDRTLTLPDNSGTIMTNSGNEAASFATLAVAGNNISAQNSLGFRNRIINGDMRIDQRNAGASVTLNDEVFPVDRFRGHITQLSKLTAQRSTVAPAGFNNSLLITSSSAYSVASSDFFDIAQAIEGFNAADLGWGTASAQSVTVSFWVRSSLTGTFGGAVRNSAGNRSYPFTYTISAANTWEQKTVTIAGDTTGTWVTDNGTGIRLAFSLGAGSTPSGTAGAWAGSSFWSTTGATSVVGTSGATFYITGVQLEAGSVATPFERRPYGTELALCQRYYASISIPNYQHVVTTGTLGIYPIPIPFPTAMRATPTLALQNITSNEGTSYTLSASANMGFANWSFPTFGTASISFTCTTTAEL